MLFRRFLRDRKVGIAPILALGLVPLVGAVGAAADYSRASAVHTAMQAALNSTALMLSKDTKNLTPDQLKTKATAYFTALFNRPEATNVAIREQMTTIDVSSYSLSVSASAKLDTMFWRVMGQRQFDITAAGEVVWGIKKLSLALALDNTGPEPRDIDGILDRRTHAEGLRQRQGRQDPGLHSARDPEQREPAVTLRQQSEYVLRGLAGERAQQRPRLDRAKTRQPADVEIKNAAQRAVLGARA